jgi:hypothetical protein
MGGFPMTWLAIIDTTIKGWAGRTNIGRSCGDKLPTAPTALHLFANSRNDGLSRWNGLLKSSRPFT